MRIAGVLLMLTVAFPAAAQSIEGRWKLVAAEDLPHSIRADGGNLTRRLTLERQ